MEWVDDGIILSARQHGESAAIVSLLTPAHGRHGGLVRGGARPAQRGTLSPGNRVHARWRGRLDEHLGTYTCEPVDLAGARLLDRPGPLAALASACALADATLQEREPHAAVYAATSALLDALAAEAWAAAYVRWEVALLGRLGFGLDLSACAATGRNDQLAYVSPRSGRAVSLSAGAPYRDRLLALPAFLLDDTAVMAAPAEVAAGLSLTGFFLARYVLAPPLSLPPARTRLAERFR